MWTKGGSRAALMGVAAGSSGRLSWPSLTTGEVTDNAEGSPRGERRVEDIVCWGSIVGFSPKRKGVFNLRFYGFLVKQLKKGGEDRK